MKDVKIETITDYRWTVLRLLFIIATNGKIQLNDALYLEELRKELFGE